MRAGPPPRARGFPEIPVRPPQIRQPLFFCARRAVQKHGHAEVFADMRANAMCECDRNPRVGVTHDMTADVVHDPATRVRRGVLAQIHK